jgi:hypothetical protein
MRAIASVILAASAASACGAEWPRFRGPNGSGVTSAKNLPVKWSATESIAWKTELPGAGASSPVVWGERIFVTCYSGFDRWKSSSNFEGIKLHVICLDVSSGAVLWQQAVPHRERQAMGGYGGTRWHGYATATPAVDDRAVYVSFGHNGLHAFSHDGKPLWRANPGNGIHVWGDGASPVLCEGLLILNAACEDNALHAYDPQTGKRVWRSEIVKSSWSTPVVARVADKPQVVFHVDGGLAGVGPNSGKELWRLPGARDYAPTSPIVHEGIVYYSLRNTHGGTCTQALKLTAEGKPEVLWSTDQQGAVVASPVYDEGRLYWTEVDERTPRSKRCFYCADAATGKVLYQAQPEPVPKTIYASPLLGDGRIYYVSLRDGTYVVKAGPTYELLAHNVIEGDEGCFTASPTPLGDGRLLLRSDWGIYCIGKR